MGRILMVSNRLPVKVVKKKGNLNYEQSAGGLATGLNSLDDQFGKMWIGWPGYCPVKDSVKEGIRDNLVSRDMQPVFLTRKEVEEYYEGFSNKTIWPLFHYFTQYVNYNQKYWTAYKKVNQYFAKKVIKYYRPGDYIWVHDYQLMLVPGILRQQLPEALIGYFLHIPYPSYEIYRLLPWREELLKGVLGSDLIGFHTYEYMRHFMSSVYRILGLEQSLGRLVYEGRFVNVDTFPMGIDYEKFANANKVKEIRKEAGMYELRFGSYKLILSVDRLDYSKGILQRLKAFNQLLEHHPLYEGKVSLILVVVPSRSGVYQYQHLKEEVDEMVGYINGRFGALDWVPIHYFYRALTFNSLSALYSIADIALVTPFRDGMNLIAKEFIASKTDGKGVLILSEMAGASIELSEALIINPNNVEEIRNAIEKALNMPEKQQVKRNKLMQKKLKRYNVKRWAGDFMEELVFTGKRSEKMHEKEANEQIREKILREYQNSRKRLFLLDYDGTLVPMKEHHLDEKPGKSLLRFLKNLSGNPKNHVVIISGREKGILDKWFNKIHVDVVAEHGAWLRKDHGKWNMIKPMTQKWKKEILLKLERFVDRTPGSFIEEKEFSLVWHYRKTDNWIADIRIRELINSLLYPVTKLNLQILEGKKVVEIKNAGVNKGDAARKWIEEGNWGFILCMGDDWTDEDMFTMVPENAYSIKIGFDETNAGYTLRSPQAALEFLEHFIED